MDKTTPTDVISLLDEELVGLTVSLDHELDEYEFSLVTEPDKSEITGFRISAKTPFSTAVSVRAFVELQTTWWGRLLCTIPSLGGWAYRWVKTKPQNQSCMETFYDTLYSKTR